MDAHHVEQIIFLLESINEKLDTLSDIKLSIDTIEGDISLMKMDISGFQHEGKDYPGTLSQIETSLGAIESAIDSINTSISFRD